MWDTYHGAILLVLMGIFSIFTLYWRRSLDDCAATMLFNSPEYLFLFLPAAAFIFYIFSRAPDTERQIGWLVLASLVFYASWKPIYLLLIFSSVAVNFTISKRLLQAEQGTKRSWLIAGICFNLGLLGYFKYTGFFIDSLNAMGDWLIPAPSITLPLAISFFTFQQIAYLVDVSRGNCQEYQFRHYALFVLFFPQLIAGPIVHHKEMMPQFRQLRPPAQLPTDYAVGLTFIAIGLFKKVVLADSLALIVDPVFDAASAGSEINSIDAWLAMFGFSFQIYFDFSGYTDIAIGSARLFGIRLPENFRSPYKASSIIDIWNRWHMTLSRFLRDYLYFTFGGNRHGTLKRFRNLFLTMLLGGLWHGAAWTFVVWGGLHGIFLCLNHLWRAATARLGLRELFSHAIFQPVFVFITFLAWSIAVVVFRSSDLTASWAIIHPVLLDVSLDAPLLLDHAFGDAALWKVVSMRTAADVSYIGVYTLMLAAAATCWLLPSSQQLMINYNPVIIADNTPLERGYVSWRPNFAFALVSGVLLSLAILGLSSISRFYYFQF